MSQAFSASLGAGKQPIGLRLLHTLRGHTDVIHRVAWSPDRSSIASPSRDGTVRIWDFTTGTMLTELSGFGNWVNAVAWSPDASLLVSGTEDGHLHLWSRTDSSIIREITAHRARIECLAWSMEGDRVAAASGDGTVSVWDIESATEIHRIDAHHAWVNAVAWSPDGRILATGAEDPTVKLWDSRTFELLHTLQGHEDWVTDISWSPDSTAIASASGKTIRVWNPQDGTQERLLARHVDRVKCVTFSFDGKILASKGEDDVVRIWRCNDWEEVFTLDEPANPNSRLSPESSLAFHPSVPVLATLGEADTVIRIWALDVDCLLGAIGAAPAVYYQSAKVILVGASNTGKSCLARALLGLPFVPQESTHGMKVWALWNDTSTSVPGEIAEQEVFLWDLAGQNDYHLIHQLFLDKTSLAVVLFDPSDAGTTLPGASYWADALTRAASGNVPRILVAGRVDRGVSGLSNDEIQAFCSKAHFNQYVATSAKSGEGIKTLQKLIRETIPWDQVPVTHSPLMWRDLRAFIVDRRSAENILARCSDLRIAFCLVHRVEKIGDREFDTIIDHLQTQGLIWRLSFGDLLLLRPELLNDYASAVILAARAHPMGLGSLPERDVLEAKIDLSSVERVKDAQDERSLLHAVIELCLERQIAFRERDQLVFPSKLNSPSPPLPAVARCHSIYHFKGPGEEIYATLVVKLANSGAFELRNVWRNGATFQDSLDHTSAIFVDTETDQGNMLKIYSWDDTSMESRVLLSRFVHEHLHRRSIDGSVERERVFSCRNCGEQIENARAVRARIKAGKRTITCQFCDAEVPISDELERRFGDLEILRQVRALERIENQQSQEEVRLTTSIAKRDVEAYDVFLAYNSQDESAVEMVAEALRRRGINPWFAKWHIPPGRQFQIEIERVFFSVRTVAVFVGIGGIGPWENLEVRAAIQMFVRRNAPVIPVLLPGVEPNILLPLFLREFSMVAFRGSMEDPSALDALSWGITGVPGYIE